MRCPVNYISITQEYGTHKGVDFGWYDKNHHHQWIYAVDDGVVIYNRHQISGGYVIHIKHDNGYVSEYGHLLKNSQQVHEGDRVTKGQKIAKMGASGLVTGEHLHFGLYKGTKINYKNKKNFIDPLKYIARYPWQHVASQSKAKDKIYNTKTAKGIPSEPLLVHSKPDYNKSTVVKDFKIYNNTYVPYFGYIKSFAIVDNLNKYYTCKRFLV